MTKRKRSTTRRRSEVQRDRVIRSPRTRRPRRQRRNGRIVPGFLVEALMVAFLAWLAFQILFPGAGTKKIEESSSADAVLESTLPDYSVAVSDQVPVARREPIRITANTPTDWLPRRSPDPTPAAQNPAVQPPGGSSVQQVGYQQLLPIARPAPEQGWSSLRVRLP